MQTVFVSMHFGLGIKVAMLHDNTTPMYHNELFRYIRVIPTEEISVKTE